MVDPTPMKQRNGFRVRLGFVPLLDSAPLIMARELGLFDAEGLNVELSRESAWASLRDKIAFGLLDGGQMLAPFIPQALATQRTASPNSIGPARLLEEVNLHPKVLHFHLRRGIDLLQMEHP